VLLVTGFALGTLSTLMFITIWGFWRYTTAKIFLLIQVLFVPLLALPFMGKEWFSLIDNLTSVIPALFWLLCQLLFAYRSRINKYWVVIALYSVVAPMTASLLDLLGVGDNNILWSGALHTGYLEYMVIGHGLWVIFTNWSNDMVESRRQSRAVMVTVLGLALFTMLLSEDAGSGFDIILPIIVIPTCFIIGFVLLSRQAQIVYKLATKKAIEKFVDTQQSNSKRIQEKKMEDVCTANENLHQLMESGFYRTEKLTLKKLSKTLGLSEYKVRAIINDDLGYRNFNDYLNKLRIAEASERLKAEPETPVLNIAFDLGYLHVSSFNRAFRDIMVQTPTDYRHSHFS